MVLSGRDSTRTEQPLLSVEGVSASFGKRRVLDEVSFAVDSSSIVAITGRSGAGKTTLLGIISGLMKPERGRIVYRGQNILRWGDFRRSRFRNREIGFVFQFFNLLPDMTSYQNIIYPAIISPTSRSLKDKVDYLVEYLGLEKILHQYPATLSGGERQRVAIARAIINSPRIILADEPTGNLDERSTVDIINLFKTLRDENGMAIIIATHDSRTVAGADIHLNIDNARLQRIEPPERRKKARRSR
ncbi:MAG TPA: ABC transporter ATP-binding protein [Spirochaetota bacterium]|nr:ABC transporter ATP-binding protein [Spirochaetota bacterium]OPZ38939.1 MAG: Lipoprotein-releasing system ATP-binding protein LolD [Spirochaetes bacterium ADurb.BinA120]HNU92508.1 ABC transporter ATP-binding protein [Spirochaetota bacterium]HPV98413.1 ABC transporter ATP-binding protein [Spirochaetota bacterium]